MNHMQVHWVTLSLLIALSAIIVNLSEWQLGFLAIIMLISFLRWDQPKPQGKRQNKRRRR